VRAVLGLHQSGSAGRDPRRLIQSAGKYLITRLITLWWKPGHLVVLVSGGTKAAVPRVLVVDDEPDQRFLLRRVFERAGHEVAEAGDGAAALSSVQQSRPQLVVTDLMMPVMGGVELIRRLRAEPTTAAIPILAVSGDSHLAADADAVLAKPYAWKELIAVAEGLLKEGRGHR
jgi:CheY-like chemotaxis protein